MTQPADTRMSFDENSHIFLIDILTNLYSNPELAVLREYTANALDSHAAAGQTLPVEITLPTQAEPTFTVKDYGLGMSEQDLNSIYSRYGASTKRDSETQIGGFGLGAKSALTITPTFIITAVKNGTKNVVIISKGDDGVGYLNFVKTETTIEANNVEVSIPVKNVGKFLQNVSSFFTGFQPNLILIDGEHPEHTVYDINTYVDINGAGWLNQNAFTQSYRAGKQPVRVSIGGILYSLEDMEATLPILKNDVYSVFGKDIIVKVNVSDIDLTPSREQVRFSEKSITTLTKVLTEYETQFYNFVETKLDSQTSAIKAACFYNFITYMGVEIEPKWRGKVFPTMFNMPADKIVYVSTGDRAKTTITPTRSLIDSKTVAGAYKYVPSVRIYADGEEAQAQVVKNLKDFRKANQWDLMYAYIMPTNVKLDSWFETLTPSFTAEQVNVKALEYRRANRSKPSTNTVRAEVSYYTLDTGKQNDISKVKASLLPANVVYVYEDDLVLGGSVKTLTSSNPYHNRSYTVKPLYTLLPNRKIVFIPASMSISRFIKNFPQAENLTTVLTEMVETKVAALTVEDLSALNIMLNQSPSFITKLLKHLAETNAYLNVKNVGTFNVCKVFATPTVYKNLEWLSSAANSFSNIMNPLTEKFNLKEFYIEDFINRYPLLSSNSIDADPNHTVKYMNWVDENFQ